jgi:uncharacterized membrane protein
MAATGGIVAYGGITSSALQREPVARASVLLNCSPHEVYTFWRNLENLPRFMRHLESVTVTGDRQSQWVAVGPMGARIQWTAEIVNERENEFIAWHSLPDSDSDVDGSVEIRPATGNRGTLVQATIRYRAPHGAVAYRLAKLLGKDPSFLMQQDLRRFKALLETGEIPTTEGQSHGPRNLTAAVMRVADPAHLDETIQEKGRAS